MFFLPAEESKKPASMSVAECTWGYLKCKVNHGGALVFCEKDYRTTQAKGADGTDFRVAWKLR